MRIVTENLAGGYGFQSVVEQINLSLESGEWFGLLGANGSGKSTLLDLIGRLLKPQRGTVLLDGIEIHSRPAPEIARKLAMLPQQQSISPGLTVRQLVSLGRTPHQPWWQWELDDRDRQKVQMAMVQTQTLEFADRPVENLSGGERQRAFLALALAQDPQVLLLDEPTTFLDLRYQLELLQLLGRLNRQGNLTIITVLHEINLAARFCDRLALLCEGKIWAMGTPEIVLTRENLARTIGVEVAIVETVVGRQVIPLEACS